jgi:predicted nucleic acid-binding protein
MSIYLDANVFIFASLGDESDVRTIKARKVLLSISEGKKIGYTSLLTVDEVIWAVLRQKKDRKLAIELGSRIFQMPIRFIPLLTAISLKSIQLMQKYSHLSPRDALHASSCIEVNAASLVSDDSDFDNMTEIEREKLD